MARKIPNAPSQRMYGDNQSEHLLQLHKSIDKLGSFGLSRYEVVSRWVELIFCVHLSCGDETSPYEVEYHKIQEQFGHNKERVAKVMSGMLAYLYLHMQKTNREALGELWTCYCSNEQNGQFFTPWPICQAMAQMTLGDVKHLDERDDDDKMSIADPCSGAGILLLAAGKLIPPQHMHKVVFYAQDIDYYCARITALNMLFFNMNSIVVWGDSLLLEQKQVWQTEHSLAFGGTIREVASVPEIAKPMQEAAKIKQSQSTLFTPFELIPETEILQPALF